MPYSYSMDDTTSAQSGVIAGLEAASRHIAALRQAVDQLLPVPEECVTGLTEDLESLRKAAALEPGVRLEPGLRCASLKPKPDPSLLCSWSSRLGATPLLPPAGKRWPLWLARSLPQIPLSATL